MNAYELDGRVAVVKRGAKGLGVARAPVERLGRPEEIGALVSRMGRGECSSSTCAECDISGGRATY